MLLTCLVSAAMFVLFVAAYKLFTSLEVAGYEPAIGVGAPVVIPSTGSDNYRGLRNSVAEIRQRFGIDLREH